MISPTRVPATGFILAGDLGGTSLRAAIIDAAGRTVAKSAEPSPPPEGDGVRSEVDPQTWWQALLRVCGDLARRAPTEFAAVEGIAICGFTRTQVLLDGDGRVVRPAMTWADARSGAAAEALAARAGTHPEAAALNAFHPAARLAWLAANEPANAAQVAAVLDPKDYLNARLTGRLASDHVSMAALLAAGRAGPADTIDLITAAGMSLAVLPTLIEPWDVVGEILPNLPPPFDRLAGRPVFCASNDTWTAVVGLGAMRDGLAYNISGTTEVLGVVAAERHEAEGLLSVDWRGLHQLGGPSQSGADTAAWLMSLLKDDAPSVGASLDALLDGPRDPQPLLFLPYVRGERVPHWNPSLRGALIGLGRRHGATDLAWAVLEGVGYLNRTVLTRAEAATGRAISEIRFGGGASANPHWCQVKADICNRPVSIGAAKEPGLLGAAILAWTALGRFASLAEAQDRLVRTAVTYMPDAARAKVYDRLFDLFRRSELVLAPISGDLVALGDRNGTSPASKIES